MGELFLMATSDHTGGYSSNNGRIGLGPPPSEMIVSVVCVCVGRLMCVGAGTCAGPQRPEVFFGVLRQEAST